MKIDAHQHFWHYSAKDYAWIGENEKIIKRDFLPADLLPLLGSNQMDGCIAVQARQSESETQWLISLAEQYPFIKGVVGWIDLKAKNLAESLTSYQSSTTLKGFRHVLQDEPDPEYMLHPDFIRGLQVIAERGFCYDILVFAHQLPQVIQLVRTLPAFPLVIDHIAKPDIASKSGMSEWLACIRELALFPHVYCKVSGMVTEAKHKQWQQSDFTPYLDVIFDCFGPKRIMFGSDWPVCLLSAEYAQVKSIVEDYVLTHYAEHAEDVFGRNASHFYGLIPK